MRWPALALAVLAASAATVSSTAANASTSGPTARVVTKLPGAALRVAPGDSGVYVLYVTGQGSGTPHIALFDALSGTTTRGPAVPGGVDVAVDGGNVWVSAGGPNSSGHPTSRFLYRFDPSTLALRSRVTLAQPPGSLTVGRAGLWVGADKALYLIDPSSGHVLRTIQIRGAIGALSIDSSHGVLYDSTHPVGDATVLAVQERKGGNGALVISSNAEKGSLSMNSLSATPKGVWAAFATGTLGGANLLRRSDLRPVHGANARGSNGIGADVVDGALWLHDGMTGQLRCADPTTGRTRARVPRVGPGGRGAYDTNVVLVKGAIYAATINGRLVRIHPGRCTG